MDHQPDLVHKGKNLDLWLTNEGHQLPYYSKGKGQNLSLLLWLLLLLLSQLLVILPKLVILVF